MGRASQGMEITKTEGGGYPVVCAVLLKENGVFVLLTDAHTRTGGTGDNTTKHQGPGASKVRAEWKRNT